MYSDYTTIEEADARLGRVKPILESARRLKREIETIAAGYDYDATLLEHEKPRLQAIAGRLTRKLEALEELGCYVRDLDLGIVDFLTQFENRDVFLSWKLGESRISHWHELDETFSQRQGILDLNQLALDFGFETPSMQETD
ncbi:DUF2203 domain-containing protein [Candidatus Woesearchaeota archaeon]|nr:DUF2203 domain-containing protein [Candidatus Woesearchaeota archaeon]